MTFGFSHNEQEQVQGHNQGHNQGNMQGQGHNQGQGMQGQGHNQGQGMQGQGHNQGMHGQGNMQSQGMHSQGMHGQGMHGQGKGDDQDEEREHSSMSHKLKMAAGIGAGVLVAGAAVAGGMALYEHHKEKEEREEREERESVQGQHYGMQGQNQGGMEFIDYRGGSVCFGHKFSLKHNESGRFLQFSNNGQKSERSSQLMAQIGEWSMNQNTHFQVVPAMNGRGSHNQGINYGDHVRIKHVQTGLFLHSHNIFIENEVQEVTGFQGGDDNDNWVVERCWGEATGGEWVGDEGFVLRHAGTGYNLWMSEGSAPSCRRNARKEDLMWRLAY